MGAIATAMLMIASSYPRLVTREVHAQDAAVPMVPPAPEQFAVVLFGPALGPEGVGALTEFAISLVSQHSDRSTVGPDTLLAVIPETELAECLTRPPCLARLAAGSGLTDVVEVEVAVEGERARLTLRWVDLRRAERVARTTRECANDAGELVATLESSVGELFHRCAGASCVPNQEPDANDLGLLRVAPMERDVRLSIDGEGPLEIAAGQPLERALSPGFYRLHGQMEGGAEVSETIEILPGGAFEWRPEWVASASGDELPVLSIVGGTVAVIAAAVAIGLAIASSSEPPGSLTMREVIDVYFPAREREALASNILFGVAGAGLIAAAIGLVLPSSSSQGSAGAVGMPLRQGLTF